MRQSTRTVLRSTRFVLSRLRQRSRCNSIAESGLLTISRFVSGPRAPRKGEDSACISRCRWMPRLIAANRKLIACSREVNASLASPSKAVTERTVTPCVTRKPAIIRCPAGDPHTSTSNPEHAAATRRDATGASGAVLRRTFAGAAHHRRPTRPGPAQQHCPRPRQHTGRCPTSFSHSPALISLSRCRSEDSGAYGCAVGGCGVHVQAHVATTGVIPH